MTGSCITSLLDIMMTEATVLGPCKQQQEPTTARLQDSQIAVFLFPFFGRGLTHHSMQLDIQRRGCEVVCREHGALPGCGVSRHLNWEQMVLVPIAPIGKMPSAGKDELAIGEVQQGQGQHAAARLLQPPSLCAVQIWVIAIFKFSLFNLNCSGWFYELSEHSRFETSSDQNNTRHT